MEIDKETPKQLFALMYASESAVSADEKILNEILEQARARNSKLSITGILLYRQGRFYQYLEGPEETVKAVYADICEDVRHRKVQLLMQEFVTERRFSEWSMGYEKLRESQTPLPEGFRNTFEDLEDTENPDHVLRAVTELTYWYRARAMRSE